MLSNKSRVSMHRLPGQSHPIIPDILIGLIQKQMNERAELGLPFGIIDLLLASQLIRSAKPARVLEYGCGQGELSVHLAELLGSFNEKSALVCAYDTMEPEWMERISHIKHFLDISFLAGGFGSLGLQSNSFDVVVVNGLINYLHPYQVLADAVQLAKKGGFLICYTQESPLLESTFKLFFEKRDEYVFSPTSSVMLANVNDCFWRETQPPDVYTISQADIAESDALAASKGIRGHKIMSMVKRLNHDIFLAAAQGKTELKIELIAKKEVLIDFMVQHMGA